jgi:hypothetical protein
VSPFASGRGNERQRDTIVHSLNGPAQKRTLRRHPLGLPWATLEVENPGRAPGRAGDIVITIGLVWPKDSILPTSDRLLGSMRTYGYQDTYDKPHLGRLGMCRVPPLHLAHSVYYGTECMPTCLHA